MTFQIRNAMLTDLPQLLELENVWPKASRATKQDLMLRINTFSAGYFVVEDSTEIFASMIAHPYRYDPKNLSNFKSWDQVNQRCFIEEDVPDDCNALYILSATNKKTNIAGDLSRSFMEHVFK